MEPVIVSRSEHNVSRRDIDGAALKVLYRLHHSGYRAYLVGGGVRDLLLGRKPKDFDISTDAHPGAVRALFRNSRIIGRRFRIVHVFFHGGRVVEVSTFRRRSEFVEPEPAPRWPGEAGGDWEAPAAPPDRAEGAGTAERIETGAEEGAPAGDEAPEEPEEPARDLLVHRDNTFGTPEEDALRRDLTINGLFYDIATFSVIDYVGGLADLRAGVVRTIGEPETRCQEDPVRMIRAVRHAVRIGFRIEEATYEAIVRHADQITRCSMARVLEEIYKDLRGGSAAQAFRLFMDTGLLGALAPGLAAYLRDSGREGAALSWRLLEALDGETQGGIGAELPNSVLLSVLAGRYLLDLAEGKALDPEARRPPLSAPPADREGPSPAGSGSPADLDEDALPMDPAGFFHAVWRPTARPLGIARKDSDGMIWMLLVQPRLDQALRKGFFGSRLRNRPHIDDALTLFRLAASARGEPVPQWILDRRERPPGALPPEARGEMQGKKRRRGGRGRNGRGRRWRRYGRGGPAGAGTTGGGGGPAAGPGAE